MSRIGKKAVAIPAGVTANIDGQTVKVKGPKGALEVSLHNEVTVKMDQGAIQVDPRSESKLARSMWGMSRTMIANLMDGVTNGYSRILEIQGVGFRAAMKGKDQLQLNIGFSHDVIHTIPTGVEVKVSGAKQEIITVSGIDPQLVGQVAANIREVRPPDSYHGKGVRYEGEQVRLKPGKAAAR